MATTFGDSGGSARPVRRGRILATVTAAQVLNVASSTVVAVALPKLSQDLGASGAEQQWVVDAFVLVFASLLIAGGVLGDRLGHRRTFLIGIALFAAGSLWCLLAPTIESLIAGRVVQALGPPLTVPATLAIVTNTYREPLARARAVGFWAAGSGLGVATGPLLGGVVVDGLGWRWVFGINLPLCAALAVAAIAVVPPSGARRLMARFDWLAAVLLTAGLALLVFGLIEGRDQGWSSVTVLGAFVLSALAVVAFAVHESRHAAPLVDLGLLRQRAFLGGNLAALTLYGMLTGAAVYVSIFLQQVQGRSAIETGLCQLPQGALIMACAPLTSRLAARVGLRLPIVAGMLTAAVGFVGLLRLDAQASLLEPTVAFGLAGLGAGLALPATTVIALSATPAASAGMASAIHQTCRQMGQTLAVAVLGTILFARAGGAGRNGPLVGLAASDYVHGLHAALTAAVIALVAGALFAAVLIGSRVSLVSTS